MKRDIKKGLFLLNMAFGGWDICGVFFWVGQRTAPND